MVFEFEDRDKKKHGGFDISLLEKLKEEEITRREKERKKRLIKAKALLREYFKDKEIKRVFLIGSILKKGNFYPFSDIDVAIEGLKEGYMRTLCELEELLETKIDLIELEKSRLKGIIRKKIKIV